MGIKPAKKFREMPEAPSAWTTTYLMREIISDLERSGKKWYRITGADCPLTGNRNHALTNMLIDAVKEGWDYYPGETNYIFNFQEAAAIFQKRHHNVNYSPEDVIPTAGVAAGWRLIHDILLESSDEITVLEPAHYMSGPASYMYYIGARVIQCPMLEEEGWQPDLDKLRECIGRRTKAIVVDHPNNPTGCIYNQKTRKAIVDIAGEFDIPVISDELYNLITFDGNESPSMASISEDVPVIVLTSFSKFFMKPGWRIGYVAIHDPKGRISEVKKACCILAKTYGHTTTQIPLPILVAATRALLNMVWEPMIEVLEALSINSPMGESVEMVKHLQERRDYSYKRLMEIDGINVVKAQASLYMFPRVEYIGKAWRTTEDFLLQLLKDKQVAFNNGEMYGEHGFGHFRTMFLNDIHTLEEVYNRLDQFMKEHIE